MMIRVYCISFRATCSGKTTLAQRLWARLRHCSVIHQDDYYKVNNLDAKNSDSIASFVPAH